MEIEEPNVSNYIDKMTMQFMSNKKIYNKFLSKNNPDKYHELQKYYKKINMYSSNIMSILESYIDNPNKLVTNDLDESVHNFMKTCIHYLEMKKIENNSDDDMLFPIDMDEDDNNYSDNDKCMSLWGKKIKKLSPSMNIENIYINSKK